MNNNQWEALIKLIIPAILLIFWVINQVFRKDLTAPRVPKNFPPATGETPLPAGVIAPPGAQRASPRRLARESIASVPCGPTTRS